MKLSKGVIVGSVSILSFIAGSVTGYLFARKMFEEDIQNRIDKEVAEAKLFYSMLYKKDGYQTPGESAESLKIFDDAVKAIKLYQGGDVEFTKQRQDGIMNVMDHYGYDVDAIQRIVREEHLNVFENKDTFSPKISEKENGGHSYTDIALLWKEELKGRNSESPYVLSKDEFMGNENGWPQFTLTYFNGDSTLMDEREEPLDAVEMTVGKKNLDRFGHWSDDPRVVYIRNEKLRMEFEVLLHDGEYRVEVVGFDDTETTISDNDQRSGIYGGRRIPSGENG